MTTLRAAPAASTPAAQSLTRSITPGQSHRELSANASSNRSTDHSRTDQQQEGTRAPEPKTVDRNAVNANPEDAHESGSTRPRDSFEQFLDHAMDLDAAPLPLPKMKASTPASEPKVKQNSPPKAIGDALPLKLQEPKDNPLPFVISLELARRSSDDLGSKTEAADGKERIASAVGSKVPLQAAPVSTQAAFTARVKLPDQPVFEKPSLAEEKPEPVVESPTQGSKATVAEETTVSAALNSTSAVSALAVTTPVTSPSAVEAPVNLSPKPVPAPLAPTEPIPVTETQNKATVSLRDISFQLPGSRGVEVKLSERAGEVRLEVRSGDRLLTQDLRGNLHELVNSFERKGLVAEVTSPIETTTIRGGATHAAKDSSERQGDNPQQQDQQPERQRQAPQDFPNSRTRKTPTAEWQDIFNSHTETRQQ